MKSIDEAEAQARLGEILEEAQRQPIVIRREGQELAAIVSVTDYERLRLANIQSFLEVCRAIATEAAMNGLTEGRLTDLLSGDETS